MYHGWRAQASDSGSGEKAYCSQDDVIGLPAVLEALPSAVAPPALLDDGCMVPAAEASSAGSTHLKTSLDHQGISQRPQLLGVSQTPISDYGQVHIILSICASLSTKPCSSWLLLQG